jgi:hypothetical protein
VSNLDLFSHGFQFMLKYDNSSSRLKNRILSPCIPKQGLWLFKFCSCNQSEKLLIWLVRPRPHIFLHLPPEAAAYVVFLFCSDHYVSIFKYSSPYSKPPSPNFRLQMTRSTEILKSKSFRLTKERN